MDMELLIALVSGVVAFILFLRLIKYFDRVFSIEMPDFMRFIIGLIIIGGLYIKKDFFFGYNPIVTGVTVGICLALLWDIKDSGSVSEILKVVISFRFLLWAAATAAGIYKRGMALDLWNKYIAPRIGEAAPYMLIIMLAVYIAGSVFIIFAESLARKSMKSSGFSMISTIPKSKIVIRQVVGFFMVIISSPFILDAILFIHSKLLLVWPAA